MSGGSHRRGLPPPQPAPWRRPLAAAWPAAPAADEESKKAPPAAAHPFPDHTTPAPDDAQPFGIFEGGGGILGATDLSAPLGWGALRGGVTLDDDMLDRWAADP